MKEQEYVLHVQIGEFTIRKTKRGKVTVSIFGGDDRPPEDLNLSTFLISICSHVETLKREAGAYETAQKDRSAICELGTLLLGTGKQCYSADAVVRRVKELHRGKRRSQ